jgi:hypothetical protein
VSTNADKIKKLRTAAALATLSTMPALAREALVASIELLTDFELRLAALEKKTDGKS